MKTITWRLSIRDIRLSSFICSILVLGFVGTVQAQNVFHVAPSEDLSGEADWTNLMQAFEDAKAAGAGSSVKMAAGTFYIPRPLQVANFSGTLLGAGKGKTILRNALGVEFGLLEPRLNGWQHSWPSGWMEWIQALRHSGRPTGFRI